MDGLVPAWCRRAWGVGALERGRGRAAGLSRAKRAPGVLFSFAGGICLPRPGRRCGGTRLVRRLQATGSQDEAGAPTAARRPLPDPGKGTGRREPGRVRVRSLAARGLAAGLLAASAALLVLPSQALAQNSAPTFNDGTSTSREFNETIGDATVTTASDIGAAITATDTDTGDTLEYTLGGTDAAKFGIISTSGQIQTKVDETYSYETKTSYGRDGHGRGRQWGVRPRST